MFTNIKGFWGFAGVGLALVALYLVLTNGTNAARVINSAGANLAGVYKTLQGR
jgi:hypothetical protein